MKVDLTISSFLVILISLCLSSCNGKVEKTANDSKPVAKAKTQTTQKTSSATKPANTEWNYVHDPDKPYAILEHKLPENPKYPGVPQSELGITVVNKDGWKESEMEFHTGYCGDMMVRMADKIDSEVFCQCFLSKIQYYYAPIHFKEAYTDQQRWNQYCYAEAAKAKEGK